MLKLAVVFGLFFSIAVTAITVDAQNSAAQKLSKSEIQLNRTIGKAMLREIVGTMRREYWDKEFGGISLQDRQKKVIAAIETNERISEVFLTIAQFLLEFRDSHTRFIPPDRTSYVEYGFRMNMVGNDCLVTSVRKDSDAEKKGVRVGDKIETIAGFVPDRNSIRVIKYLLWTLQPREAVELSLTRPDGSKAEPVVVSTFVNIKDINRNQREAQRSEYGKPFTCTPISNELIVCKLRTFRVEEREIDSMMAKARDHKKLILDLRGNSGGYFHTTQTLLNHFFEEGVLVGTERRRQRSVQIKTKGKGGRAYKGELVVLLDSGSASGSELFSRTVQIEKRGVIVGDVSAGSVTIGQYFPVMPTLNAPYMFASDISVTVADVIMSDGNRIENVGVIPDHFATPTAGALAQKLDPVLMYATELIKSPITLQKASEISLLFEGPDSDEP